MTSVSAPRWPALAAAFAGNALILTSFELSNTFLTAQARAVFAIGTQDTMLAWLNVHINPLAIALGALVWGLWSDAAGRRAPLIACFALNGLAAAAYVFVPSHATAGEMSSASFYALRLAQCFADGTGLGVLAAFVLEAAPLRHRALTFAVMAAIGVLVSRMAVVAQAFWLVPLGAGALLDGARTAVIVTGIVLLAVTASAALAVRADPPPVAPAANRPPLAIGLIGVAAYSMHQLLNRLQLVLFASLPVVIFRAAGFRTVHDVLILTVGIAAGLAGGWLADRYGRRPLILIPSVLLILVFIPVAMVIRSAADGTTYLAGSLLLLALAGLSRTPLTTALAESLPGRWRATVMGLIGGLPFPLVSLLLGGGGHPIVNFELLLHGAIAVGGVWALFALRESAPGRQPPAI